MAKENSQLNQSLAPVLRAPLLRGFVNRWTVGAFVIAVVVLSPLISVLWLAVTPTENIWPHLISTVLPR